MIFVDEAGSNLGMTLLYARSEKGTRAYGEVPCHRGENVSMISAISLKGVLTLIQLLGATQGIQFEAFIANVLLPLIWPGASRACHQLTHLTLVNNYAVQTGLR